MPRGRWGREGETGPIRTLKRPAKFWFQKTLVEGYALLNVRNRQGDSGSSIGTARLSFKARITTLVSDMMTKGFDTRCS